MLDGVQPRTFVTPGRSPLGFVMPGLEPGIHAGTSRPRGTAGEGRPSLRAVSAGFGGRVLKVRPRRTTSGNRTVSGIAGRADSDAISALPLASVIAPKGASDQKQNTMILFQVRVNWDPHEDIAFNAHLA